MKTDGGVLIPQNQERFVTQRKLSQLPLAESGKEAHVYYCMLCEEILALSTHKIDPRKIILVLDGKCPECGFALETLLRCEVSKIATQINLLTHPEISNLDCLLKPISQAGKFKISKADSLPTGTNPNLTTGMKELDQLLTLRLGQLVVLRGKMSHPFSSLLCVRATLPQPLGLDSDVVFIDGGNMFDAYSISEHAIRHEISAEQVLSRIHLSRSVHIPPTRHADQRETPPRLGSVQRSASDRFGYYDALLRSGCAGQTGRSQRIQEGR